jgi:hypothetical protein
LTICAYYSWEIALNIGLKALFYSMTEWKRMQEKSRNVNSTKTHVINGEISR